MTEVTGGLCVSIPVVVFVMPSVHMTSGTVTQSMTGREQHLHGVHQE